MSPPPRPRLRPLTRAPDYLPPPDLRQRPLEPAADRSHRLRQPGQGRPIPRRLGAPGRQLPLHLRAHVGQGQIRLLALRHRRGEDEVEQHVGCVLDPGGNWDGGWRMEESWLVHTCIRRPIKN